MTTQSIEDSGRPADQGATAQDQDILIAGRVLLHNGDEFACEARNVTVKQAEFLTSRKVSTDKTAVCNLDNVGIIAGRIVALTKQGFVLGFEVGDSRRGRIAAQLQWHANRAARMSELRCAPRIVPLHRSVEVRLCETIVVTGTIRNISLAGAAIVLDGDAIPFVGSRVRVGSRQATVVRTIDQGIAVTFVEPIAANIFDERVRP